jgi:Uma2 family endonuclease
MAATLPTTSRPLVHYTIAELEALELPENGVRYELVHGQLLVSPLGSLKHQSIAARLTVLLGAYLHASDLGTIVSPGAVVFGDDSQLEPDLLVVPGHYGRSATWRDIPSWWLAIEVLSPSTRKKDLTVKRAAYLEFGVLEIWFVDPRIDTITIVKKSAADVDVKSPGTITWHPPQPAARLDIRLAEIFAD